MRRAAMPPPLRFRSTSCAGSFRRCSAAGSFVFFDNAAGAQVPARVLDAVTDHLLSRNVQRGGPYRQSREVDAMIARARESVAAFVNARSADEIAFGLNATSFIRAISLAVGQTLALAAGDRRQRARSRGERRDLAGARARRRADRLVALARAGRTGGCVRPISSRC